jgi:hypothetical protein
MVFQCVANEVSKTPIAKNSTIVIIASRDFMADYHIQFPLCGEKNYIHEASLEVIMDKFSTPASHNII